jgi:hypothetical protein
MATPKWYKDGFILVTLAQSSDGYQHPRISVSKLYGECKPEQRSMNDARLPAKDYSHYPTRNADTLLAFEFQQNVGPDRTGMSPRAEEGEAWLQTDDRKTSPAYAGKLATEIRVEQWGVKSGDTIKRLADVDKALKSYREKCRELGTKTTECDATALMLALKSEFKLPVLFVVYRPGGQHNAWTNPELTQPTANYLKHEDENGKTGAEAH